MLGMLHTLRLSPVQLTALSFLPFSLYILFPFIYVLHPKSLYISALNFYTYEAIECGVDVSISKVYKDADTESYFFRTTIYLLSDELRIIFSKTFVFFRTRHSRRST